MARHEGLRDRFRSIGSSIAVLKLLIVLSLVGPAAMLIFTTLQSRALLIESTASRAARMSELLAEHASATFDAYNLAFSRIEERLARSDVGLDETSLHDFIVGIDRDMKSIDSIVLIGPDWKPIAHSREFPAPKTYIGDREYIRILRNAHSRPGSDSTLIGRDGFTLGVPVESRYSGRIVLVGARPRKSASGEIVGAMLVSLATDYFEGVFRTLALTDHDRVALVRADSRVLAQAPARPGHTMLDPPASALSRFIPVSVAFAGEEQPRLAEGTRDDRSPHDGERRISSLSKLDGYPVFVELGYSVDTVLEPWRQQVLINAGVAALATLLFYAAARLALSNALAETRAQQLALAETRQRSEAESALRQAQKMETLGQLTGGIAHDFGNLLNIVTMNLELAGRRVQQAGRADAKPLDAPKLEGYLQGALQGAERGIALTRRLLAFAHREDVEPTDIRVPELVFGLSELLGQAVGSKVRIVLDCPSSLPVVRADATEFETALLNLVVNARDAMPAGGKVHVSARLERGSTGRFLVMSVRDTGPGMDAETLARATEPFFTTKEAGKGSGLGLTTVERFATRAGGHLNLLSRPGEGTTAEIWLQAA